jgi:DnaJ-class molecular chaperone
MNPFLVFDLDLTATDDDLAARYRELVTRYPPDQHPELFAEVRAAYEALRGRRNRLKTWLFWFDRFGRALVESEKMLREDSLRTRVDSDSLGAVLRSLRAEGDHD